MRVARALLLVVAFPASALDWSEPRSLVDAALQNNPTILRLQSEAEAARQRIAPAASLPNPMAMAGVQNKEIDLSDDPMMTMYMVGVEQMFTSRAKRDARRSVAELELSATEQEIAAATAEIERDVLVAWYDAAAADSRIAAAEEVRTLVDAMIDAARVRYEVGGAVQAEVIRAQLERSNVDHLILTLRGERSAAVARLLPLLGVSTATVVPPLHLPHETEQLEIGEVSIPDDHPALVALRAEIAQQDEMVKLARLATRPDFAVQGSYGYRRDQMDMISVVASVELPVRRGSLIEPQIREAIAQRESAEQRLAEMRREIVRALAVAAAAHEQANQQLRLHDEVLVPQARLAFDSTLASYQTGATTFDAVLGAETTYLRLALDYYEYLAEHMKAIVEFEAIRKGSKP